MKRLITLTGLLFLLIPSCSKHEIDKTPTDHLTVVLQPAVADGKYVVGGKSNAPSLTNYWPTGGYSFYSFIFQNGKFTFTGVQTSNERNITGDATTGNISVSVPVFGNIDLASPYTVVLADRSCTVDIKEDRILFNADLERGIKHASAYYVSSGVNKDLAPAAASFLTATECVWVNNMTKQSITVKHKGFQGGGKWYNVKASLKATGGNGVSLKPDSTSDAEEPSSAASTIKADDKGFILSQFVPNGSRMSNASIVLEINGKDYVSPPISSQVAFSNGEVYFFSLIWDGNSLSWLTD
jgi:hypothetical protein